MTSAECNLLTHSYFLVNVWFYPIISVYAANWKINSSSAHELQETREMLNEWQIFYR